MKIRLKINSFVDRDGVIIALANNGYKVWTEEEKLSIFKSDYFVCFNLKSKEECSGNKIG